MQETKLIEIDEIEEEQETQKYKRKGSSLLDILLAAKLEHGLSVPDIMEEVDTFIFEGGKVYLYTYFRKTDVTFFISTLLLLNNFELHQLSKLYHLVSYPILPKTNW